MFSRGMRRGARVWVALVLVFLYAPLLLVIVNAFNSSHCNDCHAAPEFTDRSFRNIGLRPPGDDPGGPALPVVRPWREVLGGFPAGLDDDDLFALAKARHRKLISEAHPDLGGDPARAAEINAAFDAATAELVRLAEVTP